ncbi:SDR family oxidoreductase [Limnobacter litoralis]|uniref:Short chain dehydrogenase n=1 Tax=Limnobacter litoralis TaxID=481366 RepID=A0ABQ5YQC3_9BURK|nr:SDR family oxidoreductase [Limnobacter litoralis]GLR25123.1 short chain dehydrogenase [Limnobacter litoralis]
MSGIRNKVILVTGASEGIGAALAIRLAPGNKLVLVARRLDKLREVALQVEDAGGKALCIACDVSEQDQCERMVDQAVQAYGRMDVVINNAGVSMHAWFEDIEDLGTFERLFRINVMSMIWITKRILPAIKESKGLIVGVSSLAGKTGVPARTTYCTSKFAMSGFMEALRIELMGTGVDVCAIFPGVVDTEIRRNGLNAKGQKANVSGLSETGAMSVEQCVEEMVAAMESRKREWVMTAQGRLGLKLKPFIPQVIDNMARKALDKEHGGKQSE